MVQGQKSITWKLQFHVLKVQAVFYIMNLLDDSWFRLISNLLSLWSWLSSARDRSDNKETVWAFPLEWYIWRALDKKTLSTNWSPSCYVGKLINYLSSCPRAQRAVPGQSHQFFSALCYKSIPYEAKVDLLPFVLSGMGRANDILWAVRWAANSRAVLSA